MGEVCYFETNIGAVRESRWTRLVAGLLGAVHVHVRDVHVRVVIDSGSGASGSSRVSVLGLRLAELRAESSDEHWREQARLGKLLALDGLGLYCTDSAHTPAPEPEWLLRPVSGRALASIRRRSPDSASARPEHVSDADSDDRG